MLERLQKILSRAGITSRRDAEKLITSGRVAVNGRVTTELGSKADPDRDRITLDGREVSFAAPRIYLLLNKPSGYVTTMRDPTGRPIVTDLLTGVKDRVYPVGRLDYNTEGLLLLTNDGAWANALAHPRHEVDKEYLVRVRGGVTPDQLAQLAAGVRLEDAVTAPAVVSLAKESDSNTWISVTIHEGRYRQVRRMCEAVGLTVVRLRRIRYGSVGLGTLRHGEFRHLTPAEVERLRTGKEKTPPRPKASAKPVKSSKPACGSDAVGYTVATQQRTPAAGKRPTGSGGGHDTGRGSGADRPGKKGKPALHQVVEQGERHPGLRPDRPVRRNGKGGGGGRRV